jgi:membrane-anchored protein YejM (alkaline phosphatase superfamily)
MIYTESPRRQQITKQVSWGHWFALANIIMATAISSVYLFSTPIADTPISFVYLITTWLGHTSFITFLGFVVLILPLCYKVTNLKVLRASTSVIAAVGLALLAFDALLYNKTGFHLTFSSAELLRSETRGQISAFGWLQWFYLVLLFIIWLMFQLVVANAIFKRIERLKRLKISSYIIVSLVVCFVTSHAIHVWADARLYTPVLKQDNMFPLSYPATAKTLMARYGLLDLEIRQQREDLQYNSASSRFNYPPRPVYCSVDNTQKLVVIVSMPRPLAPSLTDEVRELKELSTYAGLSANKFHLNLQTEEAALLKQILYGIPSNLISMTQNQPVVSELLQAFDVDTHIYVQNAQSMPSGNVSLDFAEFSEQINEYASGFFIGIVTSEELQTLDFASLSQNANILLVDQDAHDGNYRLHSNFVDTNTISSNVDIIPTVLTEFACNADVDRYSTGQALQKPTREWLVDAQANNLVVIKYPLKTTVASDGSFEVMNLQEQSKVLVEIDTNLLSRSIKHLKDFSD